MSTSDEPNFKAFGKILLFMKDLNSAFGSEYPDVAKYYTLCKKTTYDNHTAINKQNQLFADYCSCNQEAIKVGDLTQLTDTTISYTPKIGFSLKQIVAKADKPSIVSITKHLQYLHSLLNGDMDAKQALVASSKPQPLGKGLENASSAKGVFDQILGQLSETMEGKESSLTDINSTIQGMKTDGSIGNIAESISKGIMDGKYSEGDLLNEALRVFQNVQMEASSDPSTAGMMSMVGGLLKQAMGSMNMDSVE